MQLASHKICWKKHRKPMMKRWKVSAWTNSHPRNSNMIKPKISLFFLRHSMLRFDVLLHNSPVIPWPKLSYLKYLTWQINRSNPLFSQHPTLPSPGGWSEMGRAEFNPHVQKPWQLRFPPLSRWPRNTHSKYLYIYIYLYIYVCVCIYIDI